MWGVGGGDGQCLQAHVPSGALPRTSVDVEAAAGDVEVPVFVLAAVAIPEVVAETTEIVATAKIEPSAEITAILERAVAAETVATAEAASTTETAAVVGEAVANVHLCETLAAHSSVLGPMTKLLLTAASAAVEPLLSSAPVVASPLPVTVSLLSWESLSFDNDVDLPCDTLSVVVSSPSFSIVVGIVSRSVLSASANLPAIEVDLFANDSDDKVAVPQHHHYYLQRQQR